MEGSLTNKRILVGKKSLPSLFEWEQAHPAEPTQEEAVKDYLA
jgi:hypothetical protein